MYPLSPKHFTQYGSPGYFSNERKDKRKKKVMLIGNEEINIYSFADCMIVYIENPKVSTKKIPKTIKRG